MCVGLFLVHHTLEYVLFWLILSSHSLSNYPQYQNTVGNTPYSSYIGICKEKKYDVWHLRCGGKQVKKILDWIYKDATVYMNRKYFKYQLLSSH